jgi:hypothetical protein
MPETNNNNNGYFCHTHELPLAGCVVTYYRLSTNILSDIAAAEALVLLGMHEYTSTVDAPAEMLHII